MRNIVTQTLNRCAARRSRRDVWLINRSTDLSVYWSIDWDRSTLAGTSRRQVGSHIPRFSFFIFFFFFFLFFVSRLPNIRDHWRVGSWILREQGWTRRDEENEIKWKREIERASMRASSLRHDCVNPDFVRARRTFLGHEPPRTCTFLFFVFFRSRGFLRQGLRSSVYT